MTPARAPGRCTQCRKIATQGGRCDDHQRKAWENKSQHSQLVNRTDQKKARARLLAEDPTCAECGANNPADLELDHIWEVADGGDPASPENYQLLCKKHHREKTELMRKVRQYNKTNTKNSP